MYFALCCRLIIPMENLFFYFGFLHLLLLVIVVVYLRLLSYRHIAHVVGIYTTQCTPTHTVNEQLMDMRGKRDQTLPHPFIVRPLLCLAVLCLVLCLSSHSTPIPYPYGRPCIVLYNVSHIQLCFDPNPNDCARIYVCVHGVDECVCVACVLYTNSRVRCAAAKGTCVHIISKRWRILGKGEGIHLLYY